MQDVEFSRPFPQRLARLAGIATSNEPTGFAYLTPFISILACSLIQELEQNQSAELALRFYTRFKPSGYMLASFPAP